MISLSKEEALQKIDLRKDKVVSLKKNDSRLDIKARVALVLDFSGSMGGLFRNGTVQSVIERLIPLALAFDDNGELDFWIFENGFHRLDGITLDNFYGLADKVKDEYDMGGTNYAPVMEDVDRKYILEEPASLPNFVIFITDGDNFDKDKTEDIVTKISNHPIFWQFIGLGDEEFKFLQRLDDMEGRYVDNADFFSVNDINNLTDDDLYNKLFTEFPSWLETSQVQDMLKNTDKLKSEYKKLMTAKPKKGFFSKLFG